MRVQSIILLLISSQEVSYSLSSNKTLPNKKCGISSSDTLDCNTPGIHCNKDLGVCECDSQYPIPLRKIGFCLDYRKLNERCLTEEQCSQENSNCFGGKQIESITENDVRNYFNGRYIPGECQCKIDHLLISYKCLRIVNKNFKCSRSDECTKTIVNSHCDRAHSRCHCDRGYNYDPNENQCRLMQKKIGGNCANDSDCFDFDVNSECRQSVCYCKTEFSFDLLGERTDTCEPFPDGQGSKRWLLILEIIVFLLLIGLIFFLLWCWRGAHLTERVRRRTNTNRSRHSKGSRTNSDLPQPVNHHGNQVFVTLTVPTIDNTSDDNQPSP